MASEFKYFHAFSNLHSDNSDMGLASCYWRPPNVRGSEFPTINNIYMTAVRISEMETTLKYIYVFI